MKKITLIAVATIVFVASCSKSSDGGNSNTNLTTTTDSIKNISYRSVEIIATVVAQGSSAVVKRGVCYGTSINPTLGIGAISNGSGTGTFATSISGLTANTTYYVRAFAVNNTDTAYGNTLTFKTIALGLPIISTTTASNVKQASAISGGNITSDGGSNITARGVCWNTSGTPTTADNKIAMGNGTGNFVAALTGLTYGTTYYARAYATNSVGTTYGNEVTFTTQPFTMAGAGVTDVDGNNYATVILGDREWMAENLKVTKYKNGDPIFNGVTVSSWDSMANLTKGAWCYYSNNSGVNAAYGKLYNWYAITDQRGTCPSGWHTPTGGEYNTLAAYLGGNNVAGGAMKESGVSYWASPNTGATNVSNFSARPGGTREGFSIFKYMGTDAYYWTTDDDVNNYAYRIKLYYGDATYKIGAGGYVTAISKKDGNSVRCIKD